MNDGALRRCDPCWKTMPVSAWARRIAKISAGQNAQGFSTQTCLPARIAITAE